MKKLFLGLLISFFLSFSLVAAGASYWHACYTPDLDKLELSREGWGGLVIRGAASSDNMININELYLYSILMPNYLNEILLSGQAHGLLYGWGKLNVTFRFTGETKVFYGQIGGELDTLQIEGKQSSSNDYSASGLFQTFQGDLIKIQFYTVFNSTPISPQTKDDRSKINLEKWSSFQVQELHLNKRISLIEQWKGTIQNTVNSILEKLSGSGSCTDECAAGSSGCSDSISPWFCQLEDGCYKKVIEACISGFTCQDAICVAVPPVKSVIFRTNAVSGGYKSGTWIALDFDNDTILEGWRYLSTSGRLSKCPGTYLLSTPDGYNVYSYQSLPQVCLRISGGVTMVKYGARTTLAEVSSAPVEPYSSRGQEVYAASTG